MSNAPGTVHLSLELLPQISAMARTHYRPENPLPYHNCDGHVNRVLQDFDRIADELALKNVVVDSIAGSVGIIYHDAGFHVPVSEHGYPTKEAFSAHLAEIDFTSLGIFKKEIVVVKNIIGATHVSTTPKTNTEKAVRLADVGNVFGDELEFFRNFILLIREAHELGQPIADTLKEHCERTTGFLQSYIMPAPKFEAIDGSIVEYDIAAGQRNLRAISRLTLAKVIAQLPDSRILTPAWLHGNN